MSFLEKLSSLKMGHSNGTRAPHKPLLILLALANYIKNNESLSYSKIEVKLQKLIKDFGPQGAKGPHYPFWRLQNDGIWCLKNIENINENSSGDVSSKSLRDFNVVGSFTPEILKELNSTPNLAKDAINTLLKDNFPESYNNDLLMELGIDLQMETSIVNRKIRDPKFREKTLCAYNYKCAICQFDLKLGTDSIALEAAHIKWHAYGGLDEELNGLALCVMHHILFDRGAFTLSEKFCVKVSKRINGNFGLIEFLGKYENKEIYLPRSQVYYPSNDNVLWHCKEVFHDY